MEKDLSKTDKMSEEETEMLMSNEAVILSNNQSIEFIKNSQPFTAISRLKGENNRLMKFNKNLRRGRVLTLRT